MAGLELTPNMSSLIEESVAELKATVIIISDSNTEFIDHILAARNLGSEVEAVWSRHCTCRRMAARCIKAMLFRLLGVLIVAIGCLGARKQGQS